ncbi:ketopantoate reductase family protein [Plantibacter flavus]|uniref:ketopantoate reductase family protein n=1 Tax=Plantibacter flavus TaxID=150123 RepID=UPI00339695BD
MRIVIVGRGVIGVTYGCVLREAGHEVQHLLRDAVPQARSATTTVDLLDGREQPPVDRSFRYPLTLVTFDPETVDLVLVSVPAEALASAIESLRRRGLDRRLLLMGGFWGSREELQALVGHDDHLLGYPIAGGRRDAELVESVLFDSVRLAPASAHTTALHAAASQAFHDAGLTVERSPRMLEWLWVHQAVNAGIISAIASDFRAGDEIGDVVSRALASPRTLARGIGNIRECLRVVQARGVRLRHHLRDIAPFTLLPKALAARVMVLMFRNDVLSRRIMELHHNTDDILALMSEVHVSAIESGVPVPGFTRDLGRALDALAS